MGVNSLIWLFSIVMTCQASENIYFNSGDETFNDLGQRTVMETLHIGVDPMNSGYNTDGLSRNCKMCQLEGHISGDAGLNVVSENFGGGDSTKVRTDIIEGFSLGGGAYNDRGFDEINRNSDKGYDGLRIIDQILTVPANIQRIYGGAGSNTGGLYESKGIYRNGMYRGLLPKPRKVVKARSNCDVQRDLDGKVYEQGYNPQRMPNYFGY